MKNKKHAELIKSENKRAHEETHWHKKKGVSDKGKGIQGQAKEGEDVIQASECGCYFEEE